MKLKEVIINLCAPDHIDPDEVDVMECEVLFCTFDRGDMKLLSVYMCEGNKIIVDIGGEG